jgi:proteasome lid subunit RPN8/RPN11
VKISAQLREQMRTMGEGAYPNEGCGILLGGFGDEIEVSEVRLGTNLRAGADLREYIPAEKDDRQHSARDRYVLDPKEILQAEKDARDRGIDVVGFWHTHPDHPAQPSQYDAEHAWPEYVYVIMAIHAGQQVDVNAFVLRQADPPEFGPEPIS